MFQIIQKTILDSLSSIKRLNFVGIFISNTYIATHLLSSSGWLITIVQFKLISTNDLINHLDLTLLSEVELIKQINSEILQ